MANDRLTGLDASFLHLEDESAHMHVAAVMTFDGSPPTSQRQFRRFSLGVDGKQRLTPKCSPPRQA